MAKLFRKSLLPLGTHHAPQRVVTVTPDKVRHYVDSFNRIKSAGNKIPIPWGHQLKAVPYGDSEAMKFAKARWNAGHIERLEVDPLTGGLVMFGTVPPGWEVEPGSGDLINPTDGCRIGEVSVGIGNWRDGSGTVHKDVVVHAALCTLPVIANQSGFSATLDTAWYANATLEADGVEFLYTLTTEKRVMADKKDAPDLDLDAGGDLPELPEALKGPPPEAVANPLPTVAPDHQASADILALSSALGLPLPPDTTPQNLLERLKVAMSTIASMGWKLQAPGAAQPQQPETKLNTGTEGSQPESTSPTAAYMSTDQSEIIQLSTQASEIVEARGQEVRELYVKRWDDLVARGLPEEVALRQKKYLEQARPAIDPVTKRVSLPEARERLVLAQDASMGRQSTSAILTGKAAMGQYPSVVVATMSTDAATVEKFSTARSAQLEPADQKNLLEFMAMEAGLTVKPKA